MTTDDKKMLQKLKYEQSRVEEMVYEYARKNGLEEFHCEWTNKDYAHSDYNLPNIIHDFIEAIKQQSDHTVH